MTKNIYALLVGIDAYTHPVPPLQGCVNDIKAIEEYLKGRVTQDDYQLHLRTLYDADATRQGIIDGFRQHLSQASSEDIALFYYAGHGSQEQAPPEFWNVEPDRLNETIICYDSRTPGGWDLADKELGKLISEVGQNNPHTLIIMDCCHSGSGTRGELELDVAVRKAPLDKRTRLLDSFLVTPSEAAGSKTRSLSADSNWMSAKGNYIFLSACRDRELAKEYNADGVKRGAFSYFLVDTLTKTNGSLTYRDLFKRTDALVRSKVTAQSPQIESQESTALDRSFLGGAISSRLAYFTVSHQPSYGWVIDGGAVHGVVGGKDYLSQRRLPSLALGKDAKKDAESGIVETTELAIFSFDTPVAELSQPDKAVATARVLKVMPQLSQIEVENLDLETSYKAILTSLPLPPKGVFLTGEIAGVELARQVLEKNSSLYIAEVSEPKQAEWQLLARHSQYIITRSVDDLPLVAEISQYTEANARQAIQRLEHLTRWTNIAELSGSVSSRIAADAVQMAIYQGEQELTATDIRLSYSQENGNWRQPTFKVKLTNTSNQSLYCALLDLSDRFAVSAELIATGGVWLEPGESAWALDGQPIYSAVDKQLWSQGITEAKDILKLIVSTAEFDATLLELNELDLPTRAIATPKRGQGTLNRLMSRVQTRAFSSQAETEAVYDDWMTSQVHITTVRPLESVPIPQGNESRSLGVGVTIQPHPIQAQARLTTVKQATRDLASHTIPPILAEDDLVQPFQFILNPIGKSSLK